MYYMICACFHTPTVTQVYSPLYDDESHAGGDQPELLALSTHSLFLAVFLGRLLSPIHETPLTQPSPIFTWLWTVCLLAHLTDTSCGPALGLMLLDA